MNLQAQLMLLPTLPSLIRIGSLVLKKKILIFMKKLTDGRRTLHHGIITCKLSWSAVSGQLVKKRTINHKDTNKLKLKIKNSHQ